MSMPHGASCCRIIRNWPTIPKLVAEMVSAAEHERAGVKFVAETRRGRNHRGTGGHVGVARSDEHQGGHGPHRRSADNDRFGFRLGLRHRSPHRQAALAPVRRVRYGTCAAGHQDRPPASRRCWSTAYTRESRSWTRSRAKCVGAKRSTTGITRLPSSCATACWWPAARASCG